MDGSHLVAQRRVQDGKAQITSKHEQEVHGGCEPAEFLVHGALLCLGYYSGSKQDQVSSA
jgi:hypothetical protein